MRSDSKYRDLSDQERLIAARARVARRLKVLNARLNDPDPGRFGLMGVSAIRDCVNELKPLARILGIEDSR